ncbi:MAG: hypothetical protein KGY65_01340 [Candidatus Thermoplasmatota archaeon]|nr:hypothetical protein [Candidatus Thermoplasmatota archaeon]MBS3801374.1 hypothetical protein [Candidatus Thermoplasmatota archaeon]
MYHFVHETVLPAISQQKEKMRIWNAGSSDRKEVYSIAMLFLKLLGEQKATSKVSIVATDIDNACLQRARVGDYFSNFFFK